MNIKVILQNKKKNIQMKTEELLFSQEISKLVQ